MIVKTKLIPISNKGRRRGSEIKINFFVDHDTGNPNSTASQNVSYFCNTYNTKIPSAHVFIDDIEAIKCIPCFRYAERAHHVLYSVTKDNEIFGDDANDSAIGLEFCYFPEDYQRTLKAYNNYIEVAVDLCVFHNIEPNKRMGHFELDPTRKTDPMNALKIIGKTYENMKEDIEKKFREQTTPKSWQQEYGEKSIVELEIEGLLDPEYNWKDKDLKSFTPLWLFFSIALRLVKMINNK